MLNYKSLISLAVAGTLLCQTGYAKPEKTPTWIDPVIAAKEHSSFDIQGEYTKGKVAIQVVAAEGKFYLSTYQGGLPGAGWDNGKISHLWLSKNEIKQHLTGFTKQERGIKDDQFPAPKGATVIFNGKKSKELKGGKVIDGLLMAGVSSARKFKDFSLHMEFRTPYKPELPIAHPDRGNSGIYLLGHYEIQVMDCFGLNYDEKEWKKQQLVKYPNGCNASIYRQKTADINMSLPSLTWQSFDIDFTAARFKEGKKVSNARISVVHNGVKIHDDIEVPKGTGNKGKLPEKATGPLYFQNHHNPVQYRNIWMIEK